MQKKTKNILVILIFSITIILTLFVQKNESYAAIGIVPSPAGTGKDAIVNTTISNSYSQCRNMTRTGSMLEGTTVVSHLATNKDWGALSYLSNSDYGTATTGGNTGIQIRCNELGSES